MRLKVLRQIVTMSKFAFYLLLLQCIFVGVLLADDARSQDSSIEDIYVSVKLEETALKDVFKNIENQTEFSFSYNQGIIDLDEKVSISANESLGDVLRYLAKETKLNFKRIDGNIYVSKRKMLQSSVTETINSNVILQEKTITGKVTSAEDDSELPGVSVIVKGTTIGTITDIQGNYSLNTPDNSTIVFSYVGFLSEEVLVGNQSIINLVLTPDITQLEELVVVGYGTVKKSDLTGSVAQVKAEDIAAFPAIGMLQSLQGRAAGVQVQQNNGEPGGEFKVRVRGATSINSSSDPLYVVDGFPGAVLPAPEDIESIEILKDASATAIYGSRASNGVIMVTTKRGRSGKPQISFNASFSSQEEVNRMDLLNNDQYTDLWEEVQGVPVPGLVGSGTDWQNEIFQTGQIQNYQLSFSGGTDNVDYYISSVYYDQKGVVIGSAYKRFDVTSNLTIRASDKLTFGLNLLVRRTDKDGIRSQEGSGGLSGGVIAGAFTTEPTLPVFDDEGIYSISTSGDPSDNPVAIARERRNEIVNDLLQTNAYGEYAITDDLKFRVNLGANITNRREGLHYPTTLQRGMNAGGEASIFADKFTSLLNENYLTYSKSFGVSDLTVMAGYSYQSTSSESWSTGGQSFLTDAGYWWGLDGASVFGSPGSNLTETALSSFYGRINYKLFDRYIITVNGRYDGSTRFAKNNKWAFFPSGAIAWNIADESFMDGLEKVSQLKLRASYGVTGSQSIAAYQSLAQFSPVHSIQNSNVVNAVRPTDVANDNLTWESTTQTDFGVELGLFNQRIVVVADIYNKITDDLLFSQPLPQYSGFPSLLKNIGKVQNQGFELTLSTVNFDGEFRWTSDLNFSKNRNEVLELPDGNDIRRNSFPGHMVGISQTSILREGESAGSFFGYVYDGVYQDGETILPGNFDQFVGGEKFRDLDGDGEITPDDRMIIGNPHPDFTWGFNNTFDYKGFDLNIFFLGSKGNDLYSFTLMELETLRGISNSTTEALNRWTPTNTNTNVPVANSTRGYVSSSRYVFDGSFVRLRNIALGYSLPKDMVNSIGMQNVRFYISAQNLLTFTDYRGYDPEVNWSTDGRDDGNLDLGLDYGSYPNAKSFTVGLNITF